MFGSQQPILLFFSAPSVLTHCCSFDQLDTDADGIISIEDYLKLLENPQLQQNFGIDLSRDIITDPRKGGFLHLSVIQKLLNGIKLSTCAPVSPRPRGKSRPTSPQKSRPTSPRNSRPTSPQKSRPSSGKRNSRKLGEPGENLLLAPPGKPPLPNHTTPSPVILCHTQDVLRHQNCR